MALLLPKMSGYLKAFKIKDADKDKNKNDNFLYRWSEAIRRI